MVIKKIRMYLRDQREKMTPSLFSLITGTATLSIAASLFYRVYVFLKDGYNPTIEIDTFFPQSGPEFTWTGLEIIYDRFGSYPIEFVIFFSWLGLMWLVAPIADDR